MEKSAIVPTIQVSKYRWLILLIFCFYSSINFLQFPLYTIISNITAKYYDISTTSVDLTGLVFMITFIIFCLPFNYLIEKYSLRLTSIVSSGLTTFGNLLKLASVSPDRFYLALIGQTLCAIGQVFMLSIPSKLASTWFGANEVSTACAIAILGTQLGVAIGSFFPSSVVKNSDDVDKIGEGFMTLNIINSSVTVATFILVLLFFRSKPSMPPSQSQVELSRVEKPSSLNMLKAMVTNKDFLLISLGIGSCNGICTTFGVITNGVYLHYFPGCEEEVGILAAVAVLVGGCLGSVVFGYILDKWHHFKATAFFLMFTSTITYIFLVVTYELRSQEGTYFTFPFLGFFVNSTLVVGFEFATEVMYPIPEAASCAVLTSVIYAFSIVYTLVFQDLFEEIGYLYTHAIITALFFVSSLTVFFMKPSLKRREANVKT